MIVEEHKAMPLSWMFDRCSAGAYSHDIIRKNDG